MRSSSPSTPPGSTRPTGGTAPRPCTVARMPLVLGWDVSGVVEAVGIGVTLFKPGDEVFGMLPYPYGVGSHAEYVTAPARAFTHKPAGIDHVQAGALPLAALTAYQALVDTADVRRRAAGPDPRGGRRRGSPRRADRQVPRRVRHRHRQRRQARLPAIPGRGRGDRLPHGRLRRGAQRHRRGPRPDLVRPRRPRPLPGRAAPGRHPRLDPAGTRRSRRAGGDRRAGHPLRVAARRGRPRRHASHRRPRRDRRPARPHRGHLPARRGRQGPRPRRDRPHHRQDRADRGGDREGADRRPGPQDRVRGG